MAEQFPHGFDCDGCYLNGVSTWAGDHTELFKGSKNPGVDATVSAVEGITDLDINYYAMVNLAGLQQPGRRRRRGRAHRARPDPGRRLPTDSFFRYIEPGTRTLDGMDTLWFARAREGSDDYSRMARQKCVMNAMLQQVSPETALRNFEKIAKASSEMISTNVPAQRGRPLRGPGPQGQEPEDRHPLAGAAAGQHRGPGHRPDPQEVAAAIDRAEGDAPAPAPRRPAEPTDAGRHARRPRHRRAATQAPAPATDPGHAPPLTGGSFGSLRDGYAANDSEDLGAAC